VNPVSSASGSATSSSASAPRYSPASIRCDARFDRILITLSTSSARSACRSPALLCSANASWSPLAAANIANTVCAAASAASSPQSRASAIAEVAAARHACSSPRAHWALAAQLNSNDSDAGSAPSGSHRSHTASASAVAPLR
jgi:hypothetical protein